MVKVFKEEIILEKTDHEFECEVVQNPVASNESDNFHINYGVKGKLIYSFICYCRPESLRKMAKCWNRTLIVVEVEFERNDYEYAGIVKIGDLYYLSYKGHDDRNFHSAKLAYAFSRLKTSEKKKRRSNR